MKNLQKTNIAKYHKYTARILKIDEAKTEKK